MVSIISLDNLLHKESIKGVYISDFNFMLSNSCYILDVPPVRISERPSIATPCDIVNEGSGSR